MASPIQIAGKALRYLSPIVVIVLAVFAAKSLIAGRKAPPKVEREARVLSVAIAEATPLGAAPTIEAYGVVQPRAELTVRPIVGGPVVEVHPDLIVGGRIRAGELLVGIDPRDFELAVSTARAAFLGAEANLAIEEGNAAVAKSEWELLEGSVEVTAAGKSLALREPYVAQRRAELESAKAQLEQARLNLERAQIRAPFDAIVLSENVELGAQVSPGVEIARLVDTSSFLVEISLPAERVGALDFSGTPAKIRLSDAAQGAARDGELVRIRGDVDPAGRMTRVQVELREPLEPAGGAQPLLLGSYVRVDAPLKPMKSALSIPRAALREGSVVWLVDEEDKLTFRDVEVALKRPSDVLIGDGLGAGERVITSPISVPLPGMQLRVVGDEPADAGHGSVEREGTEQEGAAGSPDQ